MMQSRNCRANSHADGLGRQGPPLKVRANAETPEDARTAREFGAEGIGLCRTEHMFFDETASAVREMILAEDEQAAAPRSPSCCRCSARTSSSCSRS
jgi:phosphoenolpyruvate-protein kinase (PTS system EI component)